MKPFFLQVIASFFYATEAIAGNTVLPSIPSIGTGATNVAPGCSTASGTSSCRAPVARAGDLGVNVLDFKADNTGATDTVSAINAAESFASARVSAGNTVRLLFPPGTYLVQSAGINLTGLQHSTVSGYGATINCKSTNLNCVDLTNSSKNVIEGLTIKAILANGDSAGTSAPKTGIILERVGSYGCGGSHLKDISIQGPYSFSSFYMAQCENDYYENIYAENRSILSGTWVVVEDGENYWQIASQYSPAPGAAGVFKGMDEDSWSHPVWVQYGSGNTGWFSGAHSLIISDAGYALAPNTNVPPIILYDDGNKGVPSNVNHDWGMHFETGPTSIFQFSGGLATPTLPQFKYHERGNQSTVSVFSLGTATSVSIPDIYLELPVLYNSSINLFDTPTSYNVSGTIALPAGSAAMNLTCGSNFAGKYFVGVRAFFCGDGTGISNVTATLPSSITASSISNAGSVNGLTVTGGGHYNINSWCNSTQTSCQPQYAHTFPTCSITGGGGTGANCAVTSVAMYSMTVLNAYTSGANAIPASAGSGYSVGDTFTFTNWASYCTSEPIWQVIAVSGSAMATYNLASGGHYGNCQTLPNEPISTTAVTGSGSGATMAGLTWAVLNTSYTAGSGFTSTPSCAFQAAAGNATATCVVTASAAVALNAGSGKVVVNSAGTTLGVSGSSIINQGALHDTTVNSCPSVSTGGTTTMVAGQDWTCLGNTAAIATYTVKLPPITGFNGQLAFIKSVGGVTAETVQTSTGGAITGAPTTLPAQTSQAMISDGTTWH